MIMTIELTLLGSAIGVLIIDYLIAKYTTDNDASNDKYIPILRNVRALLGVIKRT